MITSIGAGFLSRLFSAKLFSFWKLFNYLWLPGKKPWEKAGPDWSDHYPVYMIKAKVAFLKGRLLSSQSEQSERFSKSYLVGLACQFGIVGCLW